MDCNSGCKALSAMTKQYPPALEDRICTVFCDLWPMQHFENVNSKRIRRSSQRGMIFGRPFRRPKNYQAREACRKCEAKRSSCFKYYLWTYGICGAAWAVGGSVASTGCNIITLPRTVGKDKEKLTYSIRENVL